MDNFNNFHPLVKFIIAVPVVVIVIAIFIQTSYTDKVVLNSLSPVNQNNTLQQKTSSTEDLIGSFFGGENTGDDSKKLNLQGPSVCHFVDNNIKIDVQIKNKQIFAYVDNNEKKHFYLLKGDCLHQWDNNKNTGLKVCEIGQYISLFETFSSFLSPEMILSSISEIPSESVSSKDVMNNVFKSCKKQSIDESVFETPTSVIFQKSTIQELQSTMK